MASGTYTFLPPKEPPHPHRALQLPMSRFSKRRALRIWCLMAVLLAASCAVFLNRAEVASLSTAWTGSLSKPKAPVLPEKEGVVHAPPLPPPPSNDQPDPGQDSDAEAADKEKDHSPSPPVAESTPGATIAAAAAAAASAAPSATKRAETGKVTVNFGGDNDGDSAVYARAIASHARHNEIWGYPQFELREQVVGGLWSKHAFIMSVLVQELAKKEGERLEWLL